MKEGDGSQKKKANSLLAKSLISVGSAALSSVNAITPHLAGAVDVMVVLQPDGITLKSTPFYVRFGKYAPIRNKERDVQIIINDEQPAGFKMHLGSYGHAYLLEPAVKPNIEESVPGPVSSQSVMNDNKELAEKVDTIEDLLPGMMSPATVYSSEEEDEEDGQSQKSIESGRRRGKLVPPTALGITDAIIQHQQLQRDHPGASSSSEVRSFGFHAPGSYPPSCPLSQSPPEDLKRGSLDGNVWWTSQHEGTATSQDHLPPLIPPSTSKSTHKREASFAIDDSSPLDPTGKDPTGKEGDSEDRPMSSSSSAPTPSRTFVSLPSTPVRHNLEIRADGDDPSTLATLNTRGEDSSRNLCSHPFTLELSECGVHLYSMLGISSKQALRVFESHRVREEVFRAHGAQLMSSPHLMVRIGDMIYPWRSVSPMVIGAIVFGTQFEELIPIDTPRWGPLPPKQVSIEGRDKVKDTPKGSRRSMSLGRGRSGSIASDAVPYPHFPPSESRTIDLADLPPDSTLLPERGASSGSSWTFWPFTSGKINDISQGGSSRGKSSLAPKVNDAAEAEAEEGVVDPGLTRLVSGQDPREDKSPPPPPLMRKTLTPTSEQLSSLGLKLGRNRITYRIGTTALSAYVYLLKWDTKLVISDVDGTITRSDVLGHILPAIGWDWSHKGISQLFTNVVSHGYHIMYLSSRSIGQANITRDYLNTIVQKGGGKEGGEEHRMPLGPVIISPDGILPSLYREMVLRRPHEFKIATLQDIRSLFPPEWNPFYAGFGNRNTDEISYKAVGVPVSRIFIINPKGELREASTTEPPVSPKAEGSSPPSPAASLTVKLSLESNSTLASVSSLGAGSVWSLRAINESVAELFPPIRPSTAEGVQALES